MSNSLLMKAFEQALSASNSTPRSRNMELLEKMTRQYAELNHASYTEDELQEVMHYAMTDLPNTDPSSLNFPNGKMMM